SPALRTRGRARQEQHWQFIDTNILIEAGTKLLQYHRADHKQSHTHSAVSTQADHIEALGRRRHQPVGTEESARDLDGVTGLCKYIGAIRFRLLPDLAVVEIEDGAPVRRLQYSHDARGDMR